MSKQTTATKFFLLNQHKSDQRRTRSRLRRVAITAIATFLAGACAIATAHAGRDIQGRDIQGRDIQGRDIQGRDIQGPSFSGWLEGARLIGTLTDENGNVDTVEVASFRGDVVDAVIWHGRAGYSEEVSIHPVELVGLQWSAQLCDDGGCFEETYRIADVVQDTTQSTMPAHADNSDVWLYEVESTTAVNPGEGDWQNACGREGPTAGLFVDGRWSLDGAYHGEGYTFSCPDGVVSKCARSWGYKPWKSLSTDGGRAIGLQPLHHACTRAARADYCGDGVSYTFDGTLIDMFDVYGFNVPDPIAGFSAESGFDNSGAQWVAHKRWSTGDEPAFGPLEFDTCSKPRRPSGDETPLIYVWSARSIIGQ